MCLIAYSPKGEMIDRSILAYAYNQNPDGIGVMSIAGIEKFMGKKALKRARRYLEAYVVPEKVAYAIHFRWATHGDIIMENTHPYKTPAGTHWVMHNGVISETAKEATKLESDTAVYVRKFMHNAPQFDDTQYYADLARHVGWGNKLCIMDSNGAFKLCNDDAGTWIDDIWFSNTYSLPAHKIPRKDYGGEYGGYWNRGKNSGYQYIPREIWSTEERKMVPNPAYKAADNDETTTATRVIHVGRTQDPYLLPRPLAQSALDKARADSWNTEDRRSYYEALEAGLTVDAEYYDAGAQTGTSLGETAAKMKELDKLELPAKEDAPIGGDFAPPDDDTEEQNHFRQYLKAVAAGIYSS